jgi:hypothetical protein
VYIYPGKLNAEKNRTQKWIMLFANVAGSKKLRLSATKQNYFVGEKFRGN